MGRITVALADPCTASNARRSFTAPQVHPPSFRAAVIVACANLTSGSRPRTRSRPRRTHDRGRIQRPCANWTACAPERTGPRVLRNTMMAPVAHAGRARREASRQDRWAASTKRASSPHSVCRRSGRSARCARGYPDGSSTVRCASRSVTSCTDRHVGSGPEALDRRRCAMEGSGPDLPRSARFHFGRWARVLAVLALQVARVVGVAGGARSDETRIAQTVAAWFPPLLPISRPRTSAALSFPP